jgi:hypothetical protein
MDALKNYSEEWREIVVNNFKPKCQYLGYCPEKHSCGAYTKARFEKIKFIRELENEGYKIIAPDDRK